jgi:spermidine synthase
MNLMGKGKNDQQINAIHTTLCQAFRYTKSFALSSGGITDKQNIIMMGSNLPVRFQARHMAGFTEVGLGEGHIIMDFKNMLLGDGEQ